jgi:hypothetical protein
MPPVNKPSIVGERGAELFVPKTAGTIIPNEALKNARGGGQSIVINNTFTGGVSRQEVADLIPSIVQASKNGVLNAIRSGGGLSRAVGAQ